LTKATDEAISIFSDENAGGVVLLKTYNDYYDGFEHEGEHKPGYAELISELLERFPLGKAIIGEVAQKDFIRLFGVILR
jgi:type I restriction enzyme R subunit